LHQLVLDTDFAARNQPERPQSWGTIFVHSDLAGLEVVEKAAMRIAAPPRPAAHFRR
jgi:hypothetical protein